jgi:AcrR family transcriptional regulator
LRGKSAKLAGTAAVADHAAPVVRPVKQPRHVDVTVAVAPRKWAPERRRTELLQSARLEFSEFGLGGARVDRIAARTNTNKAMLYQYFGSKEKLYVAVLEDVYAEIRRAEAEIDFDSMEPKAAIERLIDFTFNYYVEHPEFVRILGVENQHGAAYLKKAPNIGALNVSIIQTLERILVRGCKSGVFRSGIDPTGLYICISALGFTYVTNRHTLEIVFGRPLMEPAALESHSQTMRAMVLGFVSPQQSSPSSSIVSEAQ